jgi:hypothetical protein
MALSQADRAALVARAAGLREEVSSLKSAASDSVDEATAAINDAKLLEEIERLERAKTDAIDQANTAQGTVADAMAAMNAAAAKLAPVDSATAEAPVDESPQPVDGPLLGVDTGSTGEEK